MAATELPPTTTASRLRSVQQSTGLSAAQLGVARLYPQVHRSHDSVSGSLSGEEILVKDLQQVAGEIRSSGSPAHEEVCADNDAAVMSLLSQGAELVGASVTAEFGATVYTEPELIGGGPGPVNPIDARMTSGGSSSGAAVAVARGIARIAHANDGGGSIRIPAAAVGLPGFKPAHQVMRDGQQLPNPAAQGFIASSLSLTSRAYELTGDRADAQSGLQADDIRLGMTTVPFHGDASQAGPTTVDPRICAATTAAAALLVSHPQISGVTPIPRPYPIERFSAFSRIMAARCVSLPDPLGPLPAWLKARGASLTAADIASATDCVSGLPAEVLSAWSGVDVVITPTLACAPPPVGAFSALSVAGAPRLDFLAQTAWTPWATLWNLTGWAALSVPLVPVGAGRWPVSVHLGAVGDRVDAATLLELGEFLHTSVQELIAADAATQDAFVLTEPGDIETLGYRPVAIGHRHGKHHSHDHDQNHDQDRDRDREDQ